MAAKGMNLRLLIWGGGVIAVTVVVAFMLGYAGGDAPREASSLPKSATAEKPSATVAQPVKPVHLSPEEAKARAERMKEHQVREKERIERRMKLEAERAEKRREAEIERMKREELPDELRYKHRPKLPKHLQQRIDAERELRHIVMEEKRHPERAEEFKKRREELTKTLESLRHGGKPAEKISEVRKNVPEQIKENKQ